MSFDHIHSALYEQCIKICTLVFISFAALARLIYIVLRLLRFKKNRNHK